MPRITVDGTEYEVAEGRTLLQALDDLGVLMKGVDIPHYCWHPKLSIDGSCRLCQVEIEGIPNLQIACSMPVQEGMKVHTKTKRVQDARAGALATGNVATPRLSVRPWPAPADAVATSMRARSASM